MSGVQGDVTRCEFSFLFGEKEYRSYVTARDARSMRFFGPWVLRACCPSCS